MTAGAAIVVGTRPEAIKLAPVARALSRAGRPQPIIVATGQHRELLHETLASLELAADEDLALMREAQSANDVIAGVSAQLPPVLERLRPSIVLVQGDTTTALAAALVGYNMQIPVGHVEAGLRTYDDRHPFPEEANRQMLARLARLCFAPNDAARERLLGEHVDAARVHVTGNTVVDSLLWALERSTNELSPGTVLLTLHRRESFGEPLGAILSGVLSFLEIEPDAKVVWPVHPNPNVLSSAPAGFETHPRVELVAPMRYVDFVGAMRSARVIVSDSGGVQEEAPSLGRRVLVTRETTERPEALGPRGNVLVGRDSARIANALAEAWAEPPVSGPLPAPSPFGDGRAGERIAEIVARAVQRAEW